MKRWQRNVFLAKAMGWTQHNELEHMWYPPGSKPGGPLPNFVDDPKDAIILIHQLIERGYSCKIESHTNSDYWFVTLSKDGKEFKWEKPLPFCEAICFSVLIAIGKKIKKDP